MTSGVLGTVAGPGPRDAAGGSDHEDAAGAAADPNETGGDRLPAPASEASHSPLPAAPPVPPTVVVAGVGHRDVLADLLGASPPDQPPGAYLVLRHGAPAGRAYIPGHRRPRELSGEVWRSEGVPAASGSPTRPPRRVVLSRPATLLRYVHVVAAPAVPPSVAGTDVLADAVRHADGLVYLLDAGEPLAPDRRHELAALAAATSRVILVDLRDATAAERAVIVRQIPALAGAGWHRGDDLAALRTALISGAWLSAPIARPEPVPCPVPATVRVTDDDVRWRSVLDEEVRDRVEAAHQRLSAELTMLENRCATDLGALPDVLDTELHALSLRTTDALDAAARGLIGAVFAEVVAGRLTEPVLARVVTAVRRQLDPDDRTLLITATAGVAVVADAADALSATGAAVHTVLPPVGVAVSGNCHLMWQYRGVPDKADAGQWLGQAVQRLERGLAGLLDERFAALREAVDSFASEAVDHGVLLA